MGFHTCFMKQKRLEDQIISEEVKSAATEKRKPSHLAELALNYVESRERRAGASEACANLIT